jgi:ATP-dependent RNA helicase DHX57
MCLSRSPPIFTNSLVVSLISLLCKLNGCLLPLHSEQAAATTLGYTAASWAEDWDDLQQAAAARGGRENGQKQQRQQQQRQGLQVGPKQDADLLEALKRKQPDQQYKRMQRQRQGLPAFDMKQQIIDTVAANQIVVLSGETGCGKTTQVPQFIFDGAVSSGKGSACNIICTQPRRISAMSVAERVASERTERVGATVGYSIRLEAKTSAATRMLFCTTGILLRRLSEDPDLQDPPVSHIFVDEVHERSEESDFLLMVLRDLCKRQPSVHLVLMSATLNSQLFQGYFGPGTPIITIPGRTHPVTEIFLEDAIDVTRHGINKGMEWARKGRQPERQTFDPVTNKRIDPRTLPDMDLTEEELGLRYGGYQSTTITALKDLDHEAIDYELIRDLVLWIMETEADVNALPKNRQGIWGKEWNAADSDEEIGGAVLVFLPGLKEIMTAYELLLAAAVFQRGNAKDWVLPLHSTLSSEEQKRIFNRPPPGTTKVVLATNIAETSITIDDVVFVIDSGRMKETRYDASRKMASLEECLVSKANAKQRAGRAGRVRPGLAIHLFTSFTGSGMPQQQLPEIQRVPLEQLCLRIKILGYGDSIQTVLNKLVEPPDPKAVRASIGSLIELQALTSHKTGEDLTALGHHLAKLPVDARIGKMLIYGAMFQCLDPVLTIAAALSYRSPFVAPLDKRKMADEAKMSFKTADSDHLTIWTAYREWNEQPSRNDKGDFCRKYFLSYKSMETLAQMKRQFVELLSDAAFVPSGLHARRVEAAGRPNSRERNGGGNGNRNGNGKGGGGKGGGGKGGGGGGGGTDGGGGGDGAGGRRGQGHTDGCAEVLAWANEERDNVALIKSVLCAALYPNVIKITIPEGRPVKSAFDLKFHTREPAGQGGGNGGGVPGSGGGQQQGGKNKKNKKGGGGSKLEQQMEQCQVFMHPTSVNGKKEVVSFGDAGFMVFLEQMETTKVYIRDCTAITAYPLLLFGGSLQVKVVGGTPRHTHLASPCSTPTVCPSVPTGTSTGILTSCLPACISLFRVRYGRQQRRSIRG